MEDSKADIFLIREALDGVHLKAELYLVDDGEKAIRFFEQLDGNPATPCPVLVLLDLNLPKQSGGMVLRQMRKTRRCAHIPVLVITSSDSSRDRDEMGELGIDGYFRKPSEYSEFMKLGEVVRGLLGYLETAPGETSS